MKKLNIVELYAGTGRSSEPFRKWKRARIALLADWNDHARATYKANRPRAPYIKADLATLSPTELVRLAGGTIDVLLGCPPCQGFSESGKREKNDPRNDHIIHFVNFALAANPLVVAMENVPMAGLSEQFAEGMARLSKAGYRWTAGVLNSALYGSVQSRHRLVMVAVRGDVANDPAIPAPTHIPSGNYFNYTDEKTAHFDCHDDELLGTTSSARRAAMELETAFFYDGRQVPVRRLEDALQNLPALGTKKAIELDHIGWKHGGPLLRAMENVPEGGKRQTQKRYHGAAYARLHRKGLARTITTFFPNAGSGRFWHPTENRTLSLREAARIQGFDDSFSFIGGATGQNATLVGNALDGALAQATYRAVRRVLD